MILMVVAAVLVNNILLAQFLGNCPFQGTSKKMDTAIGMAAAVIFVLTLAGAITWMVQTYVLEALNLVYLQTIVFILVIATLVQFVEMFLKKAMPPLYRALGIYLPLITTNCCVLGACLLNIQKEYNLIQSTVYSFSCATGFGLALVLFAGIRERFALSRIPPSLQGTALGLVSAGLMALAFWGFKGMVKG
jgi:electron transport complex protein RnfA